MRYAIAVLLLLALATSVWAGDLAVQPSKIQVSGVYGTIGAGGAAYWPVLNSADWGASLGPLVAVGTSAIAAGIGAQIGIELDFPVLNTINFGFAGYGVDWTSGVWGWQFGFGKSFEVK